MEVLTIFGLVLVAFTPAILASLICGIAAVASWAMRLTEQVVIEHAKRPVTIIKN